MKTKERHRLCVLLERLFNEFRDVNGLWPEQVRLDGCYMLVAYKAPVASLDYGPPLWIIHMMGSEISPGSCSLLLMVTDSAMKEATGDYRSPALDSHSVGCLIASSMLSIKVNRFFAANDKRSRTEPAEGSIPGHSVIDILARTDDGDPGATEGHKEPVRRLVSRFAELVRKEGVELDQEDDRRIQEFVNSILVMA